MTVSLDPKKKKNNCSRLMIRLKNEKHFMRMAIEHTILDRLVLDQLFP